MNKIKRKYLKIQQNESRFFLNQKNVKQFSRHGPKELSFRNFIFLEEKNETGIVFWNKKCPRSRSETSRVCLIFSFFFRRSSSSGAVGPGQRGGGSFFSAAVCGSASPPALPQSSSPRHQHLRRRASIQESQGQVSERTLRNSLIIQGLRK